MIKPDLVVIWPKDIFYPPFVARINKDRDFFAKVIVVMTAGQMDMDFTQEITIRLKDCQVVVPDAKSPGKDWYDIAVNAGLLQVTAPYVLLIEQDFLVKEGFFENLLWEGERTKFDVIGIRQNNRFIPSCLLVKKDMMDKTSHDFSCNPPEGDHCYKVSKELEDQADWSTLENLHIEGYYHMSGLTFNYRLKENWHLADEFATYNYWSEELDQPQAWRDFCKTMPKKNLLNKIAIYFNEFINS